MEDNSQQKSIGYDQIDPEEIIAKLKEILLYLTMKKNNAFRNNDEKLSNTFIPRN